MICTFQFIHPSGIAASVSMLRLCMRIQLELEVCKRCGMRLRCSTDQAAPHPQQTDPGRYGRVSGRFQVLICSRRTWRMNHEFKTRTDAINCMNECMNNHRVLLVIHASRHAHLLYSVLLPVAPMFHEVPSAGNHPRCERLHVVLDCMH